MKKAAILFCLICLFCLSACKNSDNTEFIPVNNNAGSGSDSGAGNGAGDSTYSVSGTVSSNGSALAGVTITLSGTSTVSATTDAGGNYSFTGLANGSYTLTPSLAGRSFAPAIASVMVNNANSSANNFSQTATLKLAKTGQTLDIFDANGEDGELQKGVAWPTPRFTDNNNGTVTDNLTGLLWLKNANAFGQQNWFAALDTANGCANGQAGLTDGSVAGAWRLPNTRELESLVDRSVHSPALPLGHPFTNVQPGSYWTSTIKASGDHLAWALNISDGSMDSFPKAITNAYFLLVRDAN